MAAKPGKIDILEKIHPFMKCTEIVSISSTYFGPVNPEKIFRAMILSPMRAADSNPFRSPLE